MADAVIANWDGHDYQARFFWIHASGLRDPEKPHVVEVSYEADGPKGFDDVIVRYSPGNAGRRPFLVEAAHETLSAVRVPNTLLTTLRKKSVGGNGTQIKVEHCIQGCGIAPDSAPQRCSFPAIDKQVCGQPHISIGWDISTPLSLP